MKRLINRYKALRTMTKSVEDVQGTKKFFALLLNEGMMQDKCVVSTPQEYLEHLAEEWDGKEVPLEELFEECDDDFADFVYQYHDGEVYFFAI